MRKTCAVFRPCLPVESRENIPVRQSPLPPLLSCRLDRDQPSWSSRSIGILGQGPGEGGWWWLDELLHVGSSIMDAQAETCSFYGGSTKRMCTGKTVLRPWIGSGLLPALPRDMKDLHCSQCSLWQ